MGKYNSNLFIFIIIGRFFDILSTYISGNGNLSGELNILVRVFNFGWTALLLSEVVIILLAYIFLRKQTDVYYFEEESKINKNIVSFGEYFGLLYFGKKITFLQSLFSKIKSKIALNTLIHILFISIIVVSFLISVNNLLAGKHYLNLFSITNSFYQNNIVKILNLLVFIIILVIYHYHRYKKYLINGNQ